MKTARFTILAACLASALAAAQDAPAPAAPTAKATRTAKAGKQALTLETVNNAGKAGLPHARDRAALLRAQVLLDRARFSPGEIDEIGRASCRERVL